MNVQRPYSSYDYNFYLYKISDLPFIYSEEQFINIEAGKDSYELQFKFREYNNQLLFLFYNGAYIHLENCSDKLKENYLICKLEKEDIEEIEEMLTTKNQKFDIYSLIQILIFTNIELKLFKI